MSNTPRNVRRTSSPSAHLDGLEVRRTNAFACVQFACVPQEKHFASWLALCPGNRESAGRRKSGKTRRSANRVAAALRMAAQSLHHSQTALGAFLRRMKASLGAPKAITATARKMALMVYRALKNGLEYVDPGESWYERSYRERLLKSLTRRASELGFELHPKAVAIPT